LRRKTGFGSHRKNISVFRVTRNANLTYKESIATKKRAKEREIGTNCERLLHEFLIIFIL